MDIPDYSEYGFEDFLMDADFRAWVNQPTPDTNAFWRQFLDAHPEKKQTIEDAIWAVQHLIIQPHQMPAEAKTRIWQTLAAKYEQLAPKSDETETTIRPLPIVGRNWFRVAASLAGGLLLIGATWYVVWVPARHTVETSFTETKRVNLPDGSVVTLNRNSSLTYLDDWTDNHPREVWVSGEAFFDVHRTATPKATRPNRPGDAFIVHTDLMNVEVLGTKFDVNTRRNKARIILNEGKVKLTRQQADVEQTMLMQPGDLVDVTPTTTGFVKHRVNADQYDAWRDGQLRFDRTPISDIITVLEDTYGWEVTLRKPKLAKQTFTATVPSDKPDLLLALLTESFGLHIHRRGQTVIID